MKSKFLKTNYLKTIALGLSVSFSGFTHAAGEEFLDFGLYWVNVNNGQESQTKAVEHDGTVNSVGSQFYDDSKPTVIYFHGWQNGSSQGGYNRESFDSSNINTNTAEPWKEQGWNVGIFYWNQFADEGEVKDAEAKMWSTSGAKGMRYRLDDGSYSTSQSPSSSVGEIAFEQVSAALDDNYSNNIRFAGHSLGNQLAVYVAKQINDGINAGTVSSNAMPNRIELLDPFWSKGGKSYLGDENGDGQNDWNGERVRWYISDLISQQDVAITWYKTSAIFDLWVGDQNTPLESTVALINNRFWYLASWDIAGKHVEARHWYFQSMDSGAPEEVTINWWGRRRQTGYDAASASTPDYRIRVMMGNDYEWDQVEGRYTTDPSDDQFERKNY